MPVCETMKEDTSEIFRKIESHMPPLLQNYSNLCSQYTHVMDDASPQRKSGHEIYF